MMLNRKVLTVIKREFITRVRTKGFIIGTILFPLIMTLIFAGVYIFGKFFQPSTREYAVIDETGYIYAEFTSSLSDTLKTGEPKYIFTEIMTTLENKEDVVKELQAEINAKKLHGYVLIPADIVEERQAYYAARHVGDFEEQRSFSRAISRQVANQRLKIKGYPAEEIRNEINQGWVNLVSAQVTSQGEVKKNSVSNYLMTYLLSYFLMLFIMSYGQSVTRSVIEEKSQRITETIISSIKPGELMLGKLAGISLTGVTQMLVFGGFIFAVAKYGAPLMAQAGLPHGRFMAIMENLQLSVPVFIFFLLFFLMGYAIYALLFAAVGAMVNTEDEGQQFLLPIIILNILGFLIMISVAKNPDTPAAFWASLFPFFTPVVMFCRIAVSDPVMPSGAYISLVTLAASIYLIFKLVARIYRVGILMYGKKPSLKEVWKWIRYK
jgi:ABC-2 type transport system permease protein